MEYKEAYSILEEEGAIENNKKKYQKGKINWVEGSFWTWEIVKGHTKKQLNHKEIYLDKENYEDSLFFISHSNDEIIGRPQLIETTQKKIPLIRKAIKKQKDKESGEDVEIQSIYLFDEKFDKRHDGFQKEALALDFWLYRIISEEGKEYYIFTQKQLPNEVCSFKGMLIELDDFAEVSKSMKVKSLSRVFIMKDYEPFVQIIPKEKLVDLTKERKLNIDWWFEYLGLHPFGTTNRFPVEVEYLRSAFILASKESQYPLHLAILGPSGTKKTMGHIDTLGFKFEEEPQIYEGANSRIKGLSPSFKEKPANIGFLAKAERVGFIDEIGKMVEFESNKHQSTTDNILGELNFLLEHKLRMVGSGNDNDARVQATAKFLFATNPVRNKKTIYNHVGLIDPTTMSRIFWWVQGVEEQEFIKRQGVSRVPPTHKQAYECNKIKKSSSSRDCVRGVNYVLGEISRDEFLTIFDSCYSFMSEIDDSKVQELESMTINLAKEPMKTSVWGPRAFHHIKLLIDGLVKTRCLFEDYDETFTPKEQDYDLAELILVKMVQNWDTPLIPIKFSEDFK